MRFNASTDPRILKLTIDEICSLALRQLAAQEQLKDGGKRIKQIRSRLQKAEAGPWYAGKLSEDQGSGQAVTVGPFEADEHYESTICECWHGNYIAPNNAEFIAHAPDDIAYLLQLYK